AYVNADITDIYPTGSSGPTRARKIHLQVERIAAPIYAPGPIYTRQCPGWGTFAILPNVRSASKNRRAYKGTSEEYYL
ncbi:unnamed protein product, partial [marine sediment metagenome]